MNRRLNPANLLTIARLILAPAYVAAFLVIESGQRDVQTLLTVMWALFVVMELTDVLDGVVARRRNLITDLGKILDPFADVVCRLTYFVVLTVAGILPLWFVMIVLYRELGSVFLRLLFLREGHALGAGVPGKLKSWFYFMSAAISLFLYSVDRLPGALPQVRSVVPTLSWVAVVIYTIAALLAVWSILGYIMFYARRRKQDN